MDKCQKNISGEYWTIPWSFCCSIPKKVRKRWFLYRSAKFPTKGPNKTSTACSSKYSRVSISTHPDLKTLTIVQLHSQYNRVTTLKGLSGLGSRYTTELGMNISVAEQSVWNEYTTVRFLRDSLFEVWLILIETSWECPVHQQGLCPVWSHDSAYAQSRKRQ